MPNSKWHEELSRVKMVHHALAYAKKGWPVFPIWWLRYSGECACQSGSGCSSSAKHPLIPGWHLAATTDQDQVTDWWASWPNANIAIATGKPAGFTVLDIDPPAGQRSLWQMMQQFGQLDPTPVSLTGGGGRHILWRWMPEHRCSQSIRPGIDVRSSGGYIIAPPSLHKSGERYQWHTKGHPRAVKLGTAPGWVESLLRGRRFKTSRRGNSIPCGPISKGSRNNTLFRYACRFQRQSLDDEDLANQVHSLNAKLCKPPLRDREVEKIITSALRYQKGAQ